MMSRLLLALALAAGFASAALAQRTQKPPLHGQEWMAVTGKPLGAAAGAKIFLKGGNAVDAACAMIAATATMWDTLHWGGETQALVYNPHTKKVIGINALGVAPTGATPEFFKSKGMDYPPPYGPLAAVTPGTPGGILTMLAEYGKLSARGGAGARNPHGRWLSHRGAERQLHRAPEGPAHAMARLAPHHAAAAWATTRPRRARSSASRSSRPR